MFTNQYPARASPHPGHWLAASCAEKKIQSHPNQRRNSLPLDDLRASHVNRSIHCVSVQKPLRYCRDLWENDRVQEVYLAPFQHPVWAVRRRGNARLNPFYVADMLDVPSRIVTVPTCQAHGDAKPQGQNPDRIHDAFLQQQGRQQWRFAKGYSKKGCFTRIYE